MQKRKCFLIGCCAVVGICIVQVAARSFRAREGALPPVQSIRVHSHMLTLPEVQAMDQTAGKALESIHGFERFMDSLQKDSGGRRVYDSIVAVRPGLLDSAHFAAGYYQSNN